MKSEYTGKNAIIYQSDYLNPDRCADLPDYEGVAVIDTVLESIIPGTVQCLVVFGDETEAFERTVNVEDIY